MPKETPKISSKPTGTLNPKPSLNLIYVGFASQHSGCGAQQLKGAKLSGLKASCLPLGT